MIKGINVVLGDDYLVVIISWKLKRKKKNAWRVVVELGMKFFLWILDWQFVDCFFYPLYDDELFKTKHHASYIVFHLKHA